MPKTYDLTTIAYVINPKFLEKNNIKSIFNGKVGFVETKNIVEKNYNDCIDLQKYEEIFLNRTIEKDGWQIVI